MAKLSNQLDQMNINNGDTIQEEEEEEDDEIDEKTGQKAKTSKKKKEIILNELNNQIPDELKEDARKFDKYFQDLERREETQYRIANYSSNLFSKNLEKSHKYRQLGNELYSEKRYDEALDQYNQALFYAPLNPEQPNNESNVDYALCLANRCATFLQLELYEYRLTDIDLAIKYNYPESKRKKLLERKAYCEQQLKDSSTATTIKSDEKPINLTNYHYLEINQQNQLWINDDKVIAIQDLHPGDIVFEETAYCKTLAKFKYYERCFNCLRVPDRYVYPCRGCSQIKFCSEQCSNQAWSTGHYLECNKIAMLDLFKSNFSFEQIQLALKCLINSDLNQVFNQLRSGGGGSSQQSILLLNILDKLKKSTYFNEDDYQSIAQIVTYLVDVHEIPKRILKSTSIDSAGGDIELFGALLSCLLNKLKSNTLSITLRDLKVLELRNCPYSPLYHSFEDIEIGRAIFPIYNQLKHDLEPNCQILKCSKTNQLIVSALKEIGNGDELTINKQLYSTNHNSLTSYVAGTLDHDLSYNDFKENKEKYLKLLYRYAFKCFKCSDGAMIIFSEPNLFYLECLKCEFNEQITKPNESQQQQQQQNEDEDEQSSLFKVKELINIRDFCLRQSQKSKLVLYSKQPQLRTVEHNLLESYRDLKTKLFSTNLCLAELEFDLSICYLEMRMYLRSIKHAMNAISSWKSHFTINEIQYLNGLIKLINVQYHFLNYINTTNKELDQEHITLYNYHLDDLRANLQLLIDSRTIFIGDHVVQEKLFNLFNGQLKAIDKFEKKQNNLLS